MFQKELCDFFVFFCFKRLASSLFHHTFQIHTCTYARIIIHHRSVYDCVLTELFSPHFSSSRSTNKKVSLLPVFFIYLFIYLFSSSIHQHSTVQEENRRLIMDKEKGSKYKQNKQTLFDYVDAR